MDGIVKPPFPTHESTGVTDALVRVDISYLDSATSFREFLPGRLGMPTRQAKWTVIKAKLAEYLTLVGRLFMSFGREKSKTSGPCR
jgi:hypothetical protein